MISLAEIKVLDRSDMFSVIRDFPSQLQEAVKIGRSIHAPEFEFKNIILCGMGGSAIGGDILRSYCMSELSVPFLINRNYIIPHFAKEDTLVIASSYSGETEETLSAYEDAKKKRCRIITITSGGKLFILSNNEGYYNIKIPGGYQPRCAFAFSFIPLMFLFKNYGLIHFGDKIIYDLINYIKIRSDIYSQYSNNENPAVLLAQHIYGKIPLVYSSSDLLAPVSLRWRNQFSENAKTLSFGNEIPEMNHNEICGWENNREILRNFAVIMLYDKEDIVRNSKRLTISNELIQNYCGISINVDSEGKSKLERLLDLVYLGDWVSYYLAILYKSDPTEIKNINKLRNKIAEI